MADHGVLIVAHGSLAEGLLEAASMIVGKTENTKAVCSSSTQGVEGLEKAVQAALEQFTDCDGVLCLVDIPGGSPARVIAAQSYKYKCVEILHAWKQLADQGITLEAQWVPDQRKTRLNDIFAKQG